MRTCPYCAEEIKDEARRCPHCTSWLVTEVPQAALTPPAGVAAEAQAGAQTSPGSAAPTAQGPGPAAAPGEKVEFTHTGERYLLGYTATHFGIWDRQAPAEPIERFPRTDEGWRQAWLRYVAIEKNWMDLRTGQRST